MPATTPMIRPPHAADDAVAAVLTDTPQTVLSIAHAAGLADPIGYGPGRSDGRERTLAALRRLEASGRARLHDTTPQGYYLWVGTDAEAARDAPSAPGRYAVTNASTAGYALRTDVRADADRCAAAIGGRVIDLLPVDRPRLSTALTPHITGDRRDGRLGMVALVGDDYRIEAVQDGTMWQARRTSGPRTGSATIGNLGTVSDLKTAILLVVRDAGAYSEAWFAAHPTTIKVDGYTYVRADAVAPADRPTDAEVYIWLADAHGADAPTDPIARAVFRASDGTAGAAWSYVDTGARETDEETGFDAPVCAWVLGDDPAGVQADPPAAAVLDAALTDVGAAYEQFAAADARMGDPYP
jgi:hypothetical protein